MGGERLQKNISSIRQRLLSRRGEYKTQVSCGLGNANMEIKYDSKMRLHRVNLYHE